MQLLSNAILCFTLAFRPPGAQTRISWENLVNTTAADRTSAMASFPCNTIYHSNENVSSCFLNMMTSSSGNIFRVTGPLWKESPGLVTIWSSMRNLHITRKDRAQTITSQNALHALPWRDHGSALCNTLKGDALRCYLGTFYNAYVQHLLFGAVCPAVR